MRLTLPLLAVLAFAPALGAAGIAAAQAGGGAPLAPNAPISATTPAAVEEPQGPAPGLLPALITGNGVLDSRTPDIVLAVRAGVQFTPAYLGSSQEEFKPDGQVRLDYIRFPNGFEFGSNSTVGFQEGLGLKGSARYIGRRDSSDFSEIRGLNDVPASLELGLGLGLEEPNYRAFGNLRYGVVGHNAWVGELGADGIAYPVQGLTMTLGPRLSFGTDSFAQTYFGVSPSEANNSNLQAFDARGGLLGAGVELGARYLFNERWGVEGTAGWQRLLNDAADSPITESGSADQYRIRVGLTRRISLDF